MKVIVGLGNPGNEYNQTRHNVGFMLIDALAEHLKITIWKDKFSAKIAEGRIGSEKILLVKPQTFMNLSGNAVQPLLNWYKLGLEDLVVAHDDMDIEVGTMRIRRKGSSGGHRGIESILVNIGDENFARIRIGVGRPLPGWTVVNHVLAKFTGDDSVKIKEVIQSLLPAVECIVKEDVDKAMNKFNPKKVKKQKSPKQEVAMDQAQSETQEGTGEKV